MPWWKVMRDRDSWGREMPRVWRTLRVGWALVVLLAVWPVVAAAQSTINPSMVEFTPSADHAALTPEGQPVVTEYRFEVWIQGAAAPMQTTTLGKPAPESDGKIRATPALLLAVPVGQTCYATVSAIGPTGEGRSLPSNLFERRLSPAPPVNVGVLRTGGV